MTDRLTDAVSFAAHLHRHQLRKGTGTPYLGHLLAVCAQVMEAGGTEDECIAALLHDAVEDQGGAETAERILTRFGPAVAIIVEGCSEDRGQGAGWAKRKRAAIRDAATADRSVRLVLSADKLHNARSLLAAHSRLGAEVWQRFKGGRAGTLWYMRSMADAIGRAGGSPLLAELRDAIGRLEALDAVCSSSPDEA